MTSRKSFRSSRTQTLFFGGTIGNKSVVRRLSRDRQKILFFYHRNYGVRVSEENKHPRSQTNKSIIPLRSEKKKRERPKSDRKGCIRYLPENLREAGKKWKARSGILEVAMTRRKKPEDFRSVDYFQLKKAQKEICH